MFSLIPVLSSYHTFRHFCVNSFWLTSVIPFWNCFEWPLLIFCLNTRLSRKQWCVHPADNWTKHNKLCKVFMLFFRLFIYLFIFGKKLWRESISYRVLDLRVCMCKCLIKDFNLHLSLGSGHQTDHLDMTSLAIHQKFTDIFNRRWKKFQECLTCLVTCLVSVGIAYCLILLQFFDVKKYNYILMYLIHVGFFRWWFLPFTTTNFRSWSLPRKGKFKGQILETKVLAWLTWKWMEFRQCYKKRTVR